MASRSQLANSIREASIGDSIMADIEASIQSSSSASTGKGAVTASRYLADTSDKVANMKSRALGARTDAGLTPKEDNFVVDKLSGVARDWMTSMLGDDDETKPVIAERRSEIMSQEAMAPLDENTSVDEKFLRTGKLPPVPKKATPDDINSAVQEAIEYDGETTSSAGLMSRKTAPRPFTALEIEQAAEMGVTISNKNGLPADENGDIVKANAFTDFFKNLFGSDKDDSFEDMLTQRLIKEEEFKDTAYKATKTEKHLTIGYGHYGEDVKAGQEITEEAALKLLKKDINKRLPAIRKAIPSFDSLSQDLKIEIAQSWFRGGMSGSPETIKLINKGKFKEASIEFLDNEEYRNAKQLGRAGIIPRMKAVSSALANEGSGSA